MAGIPIFALAKEINPCRQRSETYDDEDCLNFEITPPKCIHRISINRLSGVPSQVKEASVHNSTKEADQVSVSSFSESLLMTRESSASQVD
jgi:hypothetical protein